MKNILVLIHEDVGQEARFQAALDLTRALGGHLTCLDVAIMPAAVEDYATLGGAALLVPDERVSESENRARIDARLQHEAVPYNWLETVGFASQAIRDAAGLSDVIVLNRDIKNSYPDMEEIATEVLLNAGRPILAVPGDSRGFDAFGHALVAWDGSKEADAALLAATPLLRYAGTVTIVEVDDGSIKMPVTQAATHLSRHGIKSIIRQIRVDADIPSTVLLQQIDAVKAAYLVMGGFGHSRFREATLGGVSRRMLHECPVPLFMAH